MASNLDKKEQTPTSLRARVAETIGLALIALLILAVTLVRYWHAIHWNVR